MVMLLIEVRCDGHTFDKHGNRWPCNRILGKFEGKAEVKCNKCGKINKICTERQKSAT